MYKFIIAFSLIVSMSYTYSLQQCIVTGNTCSAFGKWDKTGEKCQCSNLFWGDYCEFGRKRLTATSGIIVESENHYRCNSKYMYLIDSGSEMASIRLNIKEFQTECNWDHLYIFDGTSIYSPLLASLSGITQVSSARNNSNNDVITSHSGAMFLYFYSDLNINEQGFNLTYHMSKCNSTFCNQHGFCYVAGNCSCDKGWTGSNCELRQCCQDELDIILHTEKRFCKVCDRGSTQVSKRASHASVIVDDKLWLYDGYSFNVENSNISRLLYYDFQSFEWYEVNNQALEQRFGHSLVTFGKSLIVYGGKTIKSSRISCESFKYEIRTNSWRQIQSMSPLCVFGHASVVAGNSMFVFFGYNEEETFTSSVQKLNLDNEEWSLVLTSGAKAKGRFGHSANYDPDTGVVYVFGGFIVRQIINELLLYNVAQSKWSVGKASPMPVYLHSAMWVGRNLLIFGGNRYNGTDSTNKICHSNDFFLYNSDCKKWESVNSSYLLQSKNRYGHSAAYFNRSLYIFGGYDGQLKNDIFRIVIADDPDKYLSEETCLYSPVVTGHVWNKRQLKCVSSQAILPESDISRRACKDSDSDRCTMYASCSTCTNASCLWLDARKKCYTSRQELLLSENQPIGKTEKCGDEQNFLCSMYQNCRTCNQNPYCDWNRPLKICSKANTKLIGSRDPCYGSANVTSCEQHSTCTDCLSQKNSQCLWCHSQNECIQSNTYTVNYAYGQCHEWFSSETAMCKVLDCSAQTTCHKCFQQPGCGWCSKGPNTGLGECMEGSELSPVSKVCPAPRWYFTECPGCYCNGHSGCPNGTNECEKCYGHVTGSHCETCEPGYFGNPEGNGTCTRCFCNGHFRACDPKTGNCECNLKGAIGDHCQLCDRVGNYYGNATNNGLCYFLMIVDYHYRSNLTKVTKAAFLARPKSRSSALKFEISHASGAFGFMNISLHYGNGHTRLLRTNQLIGVYRVTIESEDYEFPDEDVELRFIVFGWKNDEHFAFKATLTHPPKHFDLVYFLIMFLVCFCGLLLLLIIIWKVKQRYDMCVRRRRHKYEMRERISRPSKSIKINLRPKPPELFQKVTPTLISCEDFSTGHLAVGTFLIEYPRDSDGYPPAGSSGLAFGSTLLNTNSKRTFTHKHMLYSQAKRRKNRPTTHNEVEL